MDGLKPRSLLEKQWAFAEAVSLLLAHVASEGYHCALVWAWRPPAMAEEYSKRGIGIRNSLHGDKLALDLDLFDGAGKYLDDTESHRRFGMFWEQLDEDATWGGRWGDGNHYSFRHGGRK